MKKKVTPKKVARFTVNDVLIIEGTNLPPEIAKIFSEYYKAFLSQGFTVEQSFTLTLKMADFYLRPVI